MHQINPQRRAAWIHPDQAKAGKGKGKAIAVPLNDEDDLHHIVAYKGKTVSRAHNQAMRKALNRAEVKDFR